MIFTASDLISIIVLISGLIGIYIKLKTDMITNYKDNEQSIALLKQEITLIKQINVDKDTNFEKVLDKLESAIEKLNYSQNELSKAILELRAELKYNKE